MLPQASQEMSRSDHSFSVARRPLRGDLPSATTAPATSLSTPAFTLVELLVVIAVIAILAALILPALNRGKIAAQSASCKNNLRQWSIALRLYVDETGVYPPFSMGDTATGDVIDWPVRLKPYGASAAGPNDLNRTIKMCPWFARFDMFEAFVGVHPPGDSGSGVGVVGGYGYNLPGFSFTTGKELGLGGVAVHPPALPDRPHRPAEIRLIRDSEVLVPGDMLAIGDSVLGAQTDSGHGLYVMTWTHMPVLWYSVLYDMDFPGADSPLWHPAEGAAFIRQRHGGRWNMAFCDGHVQLFKTRELYNYHSDQVLQRWNRDHLPHPENVSTLP
jgi:prepilin-type N-terminal cleavage/methylation domain-containing protein/prepilin-type processing-associated H-X9-DG protein